MAKLAETTGAMIGMKSGRTYEEILEFLDTGDGEEE